MLAAKWRILVWLTRQRVDQVLRLLPVARLREPETQQALRGLKGLEL